MKVFLVFCLLFITSCMVGPNYCEPEMDMPVEFIEAASVENAFDCDLYHWWNQFEDPCLDALIAKAIEANFDVRLALERIEQARAQLSLASAQLWPEIDLNATATRTRNSQNFLSSSSTTSSSSSTASSSSTMSSSLYQNFFRIGLDAIWELDFFGKFRRAQRAAYYTWEASIEAAQAMLISILSEVAINYISIRALQQKIALTLELIEIDKEELLLTRDLFQAGLTSELEVDTILSTLESDQATLPTLESSLKQIVYALALLLGKQPQCLEIDLEELSCIPCGINKIPLGLPSDLLRRRPDIKQAERQLAAATEQIGVAVADLFPHISLTGTTIAGGSLGAASFGFESSRLNNLLKAPSRFWSIGPNILWDVIDFGKVRSNIAIQNSLQRQAFLNYEQVVTAALKDVEGALAAYCEEQKRFFLLEHQVAVNERSVELNLDLFQSGLSNDLTVLEAKKLLLIAESSLIDSQQALTSDLIAVFKALGGTWECFYMP